MAKTLLGIENDRFTINGKLTYSDIPRTHPQAHGLLMNARFIQGIFDDRADPDRFSRKHVPMWAKWTGDPFYDNYSHAEPGTVATYSSGGIWRLSQALTAVWNRDIKHVLDEKLFRHIGIPADQWDWLPGRTIHENRDFYPRMRGYGDFIDPPYEINGHSIRGGGGWVVMSAANLARFGLLVATRGVWQGKQLISPEWLRSHAGGNGSWAGGFPDTYIAVGRVLPPSPVSPLSKTSMD